jgi:hypothetical protein
MRLNKPSSIKYADNKESFRDTIYSLALLCHVGLNFSDSWRTDAFLARLDEVGALNLSRCHRITDAG